MWAPFSVWEVQAFPLVWDNFQGVSSGANNTRYASPLHDLVSKPGNGYCSTSLERKLSRYPVTSVLRSSSDYIQLFPPAELKLTPSRREGDAKHGAFSTTSFRCLIDRPFPQVR